MYADTGSSGRMRVWSPAFYTRRGILTMVALNLPEIRNFMNQLLCTGTFDNFLLREAMIQGNVTWSLDGSITPDFYSADEAEALGISGLSFLPFGQIRPACYQLIKGKRTPSYFKFVFLLAPDALARTLEQTHSSFTAEDITGMFFNLIFRQGKLMLTTGISYRIFSADKSLEAEWDTLMGKFLKNHGISFENL